jgi:selenocysteine-specific elongation factor
MLDATCELLRDAPTPLRPRQRVRFHIGTREVMARVHLLDGAALEPGETGYVQLRLEGPVVALPRDRYVIRSYSPMVTIGGGELLDVAPLKSRRSPALAARLRILERSAPVDVLEAHVERVGGGGARLTALRARTSFGPAALRGLLQDLVARGRVLVVDREWYVHVETAERVRREAEAVLAAFHAREPLKAGMSKEELRTRLGGLEERVFLALLERFAGAGVLVVDRDKVRQAGHAVRLTPAQQAASDRLEGEFRSAGVAPPSLDEAYAKLGLDGSAGQAITQLLVDARRLVRIREGLYFHAEPLQAAVNQVLGFLRERRAITPQEIKDLLGISRKYAIPLLEWLDNQRFTVRVGDKRTLREGAPSGT